MDYVNEEYSALLQELTNNIHHNNPQDVLQFCADFFFSKLSEERAYRYQDHYQHPMAIDSTFSPHPSAIQHTPPIPSLQDHYSGEDDDDDEEEEEEEEEEESFYDEQKDTFSGELPDFSGNNFNRLQRRTSVSAESMTPSTREHRFIKTVIPKTTDQQARIQSAIQTNFLFRHLDEMQYKDVINAMTEKHVAPQETVIQQGAVGDFFYIVESGHLDCYIDEVLVTEYQAGGSFGELALMYNSPRAATIVATTDCVLWALDRIMFRGILMEHTSAKRRMYESFLTDVPILASLDAYERYKIADALESVCFEDGQKVIEQNAVGNNFYLIESGVAVFYKTDADGVQKEVNRLTKGAYFGELALLNDSPRAATVIAHGRLRCATLGKKGFNRLLGPVLDILKRSSINYVKVMQSTTE
ncbi:cAMP dependent protein kinase regulatory subunit [Halteromyces radiatus]|uniref:cAMP dependent protein kinase regulatory subunit n=1 Tax=Halteromyces radiatus TaxID=101107 RepID=UPI0022211E6A|nr:cAMP dependent protein kinase regulatory subunit [Halteromyces radiatus]KAI8085180.1 cAMP dependent protein kinase regulatory subunit [Halteromyces radiatus]